MPGEGLDMCSSASTSWASHVYPTGGDPSSVWPDILTGKPYERENTLQAYWW